jgi:hypothetical protein
MISIYKFLILCTTKGCILKTHTVCDKTEVQPLGGSRYPRYPRLRSPYFLMYAITK